MWVVSPIHGLFSMQEYFDFSHSVCVQPQPERLYVKYLLTACRSYVLLVMDHYDIAKSTMRYAP